MPQAQPQPLIFGEVLFDRFPNEQKILGGAPLNVSWHLYGFGLNPLLVSAVGNDSEGEQILSEMIHWGLSTEGLQTVLDRPTGQVVIERPIEGRHRFDILDKQAYDYIQMPTKGVINAPPTLIYHDSLALRHPTSRQTLLQLIGQNQAATFVDINLRDPWWHPELLPKLLEHSRWLKVNDEELPRIAPLLSCDGNSLEQQARQLKQRFQIDWIIVTEGSKGAFIIDEQQQLQQSPPQPAIQLVDTIGAGDAFSAVTLFGLTQGWSAATTLQRAAEFAAHICTLRGTTEGNLDFYRDLMVNWQGA